MAQENNANQPSTTPQPVFETVPIEEGQSQQPQEQSPAAPPADQQVHDTIVPEEIPEETPEDLTIADLEASGPPPGSDLPPIDDSMFEDGGGKRKYIFIAVGVIFFLFLFFVILNVLLSLRRGGGSEEPTGPVTLEYWGLWEEQQVFQPLIDEYNRENPDVTINYIQQDPENYVQKLVTRSLEGNGPDIYRFHNTWLPNIVEIVAPLPEDIMTTSEFDQTFYPIAQTDLKIGNEYHGLPLMVDGLVLLYNEDLFSKAGITTAPQTWDDVLQAATELTVRDTDKNIVTGGIALGTADNISHFSDIYAWLLLQNGAGLTTLNSPEGVDLLGTYLSFAEPPRNYWNNASPNDISAFIQGKVGMIIVPSWAMLQIIESNPDLNFAVAPLPVIPGEEPLGMATYWVEGVSKTSKNQREAWKFLKFLTEKESMMKLYQEQVKTRPFGEPYSRVDLRDELIQNEYIGPVLEQAPVMQSMSMINRTRDQQLNDEIVGYMRDAINASIQGVSYQEALDTAQLGVSETLQKYNIE